MKESKEECLEELGNEIERCGGAIQLDSRMRREGSGIESRRNRMRWK